MRILSIISSSELKHLLNISDGIVPSLFFYEALLDSENADAFYDWIIFMASALDAFEIIDSLEATCSFDL